MISNERSESVRFYAFTLIEVLVVIVIMSIMGGITLHFLGSSSGVYAAILAQRRADGELLDAIDRMRREARALREVDWKDSASSKWTFVNARGETVGFELEGARATLNGHPLARGVERLEFSYFDFDNLEFSLPLKKQDAENVARVQMAIRVTNNLAVSEMIVDFHLLKDYLK